jgi:hypothetical protein
MSQGDYGPRQALLLCFKLQESKVTVDVAVPR